MAIVVPVVSTFDAKGISKAISNFKNLEGAAAKTAFVMRGADQAATAFIGGLAKVGAAVGLVGGIIGTKLVSAAYESQKVFKQTEQLIATTGFAAGHTAQSLTELSDKISEKIGVDDEMVQKSANLLLTFKQVQNQVGTNNQIFDRAVMAAQDLGNVFGSAEGAAMQLGKALADPERGITALRRSGVNFTETQREMIQNFMAQGKLLEAQKIILQEVESQVGGTARATATDFDRMKVAVENLQEKLGALLIPVVEKLARFIKDDVIPYVERLITLFKEEGLGGVLKKLSGDFMGFITRLDGTGAKIYWLVTALAALKAAVIAYNVVIVAAKIATALFNVTLAANPIGLVVAAIAAVIVILVAAYMKFEGFRKVVNTVANAAITAWEFMTNAMITGINWVIKAINFFRPLLAKIGIKFGEVGEIGKVSFGRIGDEAKKTKKAIGDVADETQRLIQRFQASRRDFTPDPEPSGGGGESPIERAKRQLKEFMAGLNAVRDAQASLKNAALSVQDAQKGVLSAQLNTTSAREKLRAATLSVAQAQEKFNLVTRGYPKDSREALEAMRRVEDASRRLRDANIAQQDAVRGVANAEKKLAEMRARVADPDSIADAERKLERSKFGVEESAFRVKEAEEELAKLRNDPSASAVEVRRAEIALAVAKFEVFDAVQSVKSAEQQLSDTRNVGPTADELAEAERALEDAKYRLEDSVLAVKDATVASTEAQQEYNEVTRGAVAGSVVYDAVLKELEDAKRAQAEASEAVTKALEEERDAIDKVAAAQETLRKATWEVFDAEKALQILRSQTPKDIRTEAREDDARRATQFAPGVVLPTMPDIAGVASAVSQTASAGGTVNNFNITSRSLDPTSAAEYIVDALRDYERSNGYLPFTAQYAIAV